MFTLNSKGRLLVVDKPLVMGIINVTTDSFFEGSRLMGLDRVLSKASQMIAEGASILDIGGQSSRPGVELVSIDEEMERVIPAILALRKHFPGIFISIDSFRAGVAREAIEAGADIINDIGAGNLDNQMIPTVADLGVPYICMHIKGEPATMQKNPVYEQITREVLDFFIEKVDACRKSGIKDIIIDPGFGFGKTSAHNFDLLQNLSVFKILGCPILLGVSRKSTIYKTLGVSATQALNGTTVLNTVALLHGANILRVHDVKEASEAVTLLGKLTE
ncbi:MAG: dihydropteroate synthase [Chitinophagales bacterium]